MQYAEAVYSGEKDVPIQQLLADHLSMEYARRSGKGAPGKGRVTAAGRGGVKTRPNENEEFNRDMVRNAGSADWD